MPLLVAIGLSVLLPLPSQTLRQVCPAATTPGMALTGAFANVAAGAGAAAPRPAFAAPRPAAGAGVGAGLEQVFMMKASRLGSRPAWTPAVRIGSAGCCCAMVATVKVSNPASTRSASFLIVFEPQNDSSLDRVAPSILPPVLAAIVSDLVPVLRLVLCFVLLLFFRVLVLLLFLLCF